MVHADCYPDPKKAYLTCENPHCRLYQKPIKYPTTELVAADEAIVISIQEAERKRRDFIQSQIAKYGAK
jgi:hypothetical protein